MPISADEGAEGRREAGGQDSKEYCASDKDIVEVVRTEYVYTRPPPWSDVLPTIHIITPTYSRPVQKAELTRIANTFLHVPNLHWILIEDSQRRTPLVTSLLRETGLNYTHLNVETPKNFKIRGDTRDPRIPRGTMQRNLALRWLRETFKNNSQPGIVYFADDDNSYSLELFEEVNAVVNPATLSVYILVSFTNIYDIWNAALQIFVNVFAFFEHGCECFFYNFSVYSLLYRKNHDAKLPCSFLHFQLPRATDLKFRWHMIQVKTVQFLKFSIVYAEILKMYF